MSQFFPRHFEPLCLINYKSINQLTEHNSTMAILNHLSSPTPTKGAVNVQLDEVERVQTNEDRKVRFNKRVKRRFIKKIPEEEHENIWYTREDYDEAYRREDALRKCISANKALYTKNAENIIAQGVLTEQQLFQGRTVVETSLLAVLDEQERQEEEFFGPNTPGEFALDFEKVAAVYSPHSQGSLVEAQVRAIRHHAHVQNIENEINELLLSPIRSMKGRIPTRRSPRSRAPLIQKLIQSPSVFVAEESSRLASRIPAAA